MRTVRSPLVGGGHRRSHSGGTAADDDDVVLVLLHVEQVIVSHWPYAIGSA